MIDYQKLYISLFGSVSELAEEIVSKSDATDREAEVFYKKLHQIMLDAEERYLQTSEQ